MHRTTLVFTLGMVLMFTVDTTSAQDEVTEEELRESLELSQEFLESLPEIGKQAPSWVELELTISRNRVNACMAAIGHRQFCNCLNSELHWILGFDSYVRIIMSPDARPNPQPTTDEERAVNTVFSARERCITTIVK